MTTHIYTDAAGRTLSATETPGGGVLLTIIDEPEYIEAQVRVYDTVLFEVARLLCRVAGRDVTHITEETP